MAVHVHTTKPLTDGATRTSYEPSVSQDAASRTFVVSLEAKDGYAVITDFQQGDRIQLDCDELGDYQLIPGNHHGHDNGGFCIFYVGEDRSSDAGDLIAEVSGPAAASLDLMDAATFIWKIPEGVAIPVGLPSNDIVMGTEGNDVLSGCMGSDVVIGGPGDDVVSGVHTEMPLPGHEEIDVLIGGPGKDRFVLGVISASTTKMWWGVAPPVMRQFRTLKRAIRSSWNAIRWAITNSLSAQLACLLPPASITTAMASPASASTTT